MAETGEDQAGIPTFESLSDVSHPPSPAPSAKRKRDGDTESGHQKPAKRKKSKKPPGFDNETLDTDLGINVGISHMDSSLMADHIAQRTGRFQPELSLVEREDVRIPVKCIVDTTTWSKPRSTDQLPDFLEQFAGPKRKKKGQKLSNAPTEKGHPHTLVIAGAGIRAADLTRVLRRFQTKESLVAKLFAKHIKLNEAIETTTKSRINIGVGTPQRIMDLLERGALSSARLERIVVDASHIDQKKRGILDMKETQVPLVKLLARKEFKEKYDDTQHKLELLFF